MSTIFVKPATPGLRVRTPSGAVLPDEGDYVERESYWLRRINDGDVVEAAPPVADAAPVAATGKAAKVVADPAA